MAGLNNAHSAVRDAHSDFYTQLGSLNEQYAPSSFPTSPVGADSGNAMEPPPTPSTIGSDQGVTDVESYIRQSAQARGVDPDVAARVYASEGKSGYIGDQGSSFGPFQLHYGNVASGGNAVAGLGDEFTAKTGLNARDSSTWKQQVDFALDKVRQGGWGPWHGAAAAGIAPYQGVDTSVVATRPPADRTADVNAPMRPSQFGDPQLTSAEAYAACGPAAAVWAAKNQGKNPTLREAQDLAERTGWTADGGMNGIGNEKALLDKMGVKSRLETSIDLNKIAADAAGGNPVIISTPGHYFTVDNFQNGKYHVGTSGTDLKRGAEWMSADQIQSVMGNVNGVLYVDHPSASAPSVAENIMSGPNLGQGAPTEASRVQTPKAQTADDILGQANDSFSAELDKLNLPPLVSAGGRNSGGEASSGAPQIPGVPDFLSRPTSIQDAVKKAGDVAMNTPKPLFGPQGLGVGDPRIGPPGGEGGAEEGAGSKIGDVVASTEGEAGKVAGEGGASAPAVAGNIRLDKYPQEAQDVIQAASGTIGDEATRGVIPDRVVRDLAKMSGQSAQDIAANWKPGQAQNAETLFQIRDALADSGKQAIAALDNLRANPTDPQANAAAVAALTQHRAYQQVVAGGAAEMGRGLRSLRQSVDGNMAALQRLQTQAMQSGKTPEQLAQDLIRVDLNDPASIDNALGGGLPPGGYDTTAPQSGQLPLFDSQPVPFSKPQTMPPGGNAPNEPGPGQLSLGLDAPFANPPAPVQSPSTINVDRNVASAFMAEGKKTLFSLVPFHNISIGWGTLFGPAGPDGLAQYVRAQLPGGEKYVEGLKAGPLGEWFTRADKWPGMNIGGSNPEAGQFVINQPWRTLAQSAFPAVGGFGAGYKGSEAMGGSDEDKFRAGLEAALVGAVAGPTLAQGLHNSLWGRGVPLAKVLTFKAMVENGAPEYQAARFARDLMGGGQLEEIVRDQGWQRAIRLGALAPDWLISQMRLAGSAASGAAKSVPGASNLLSPMGANEQASRDFYLKVIGTGMLATEALQLALTGHTTGSNQPGNLFKLEVPNGDGQTYSAYSLLPGNVEPLLTMADDAASGGRTPGPNFPSSAINAGGAFIANRAGIVPRAGVEAIANQRYPGGPAIVPKGTPPGQAAAPEFANAASNFAPVGLQTPIQEFTKGAPLPAYLASAAGIKVTQGRAQDTRRTIRPAAGAPEPQMPWDFLRDVVTGASSGGRPSRARRP